MKKILKTLLQTILFKMYFSNNRIIKFIDKKVLRIGLKDAQRKDPYHLL
jgi:hypothetical protein